MSSEIAIRVDGLSKRYYAPQRTITARSGISRHLKNMGLLPKQEKDYVWALNNVSFEVPRGQVLGILGQNGSGKSTLLKILSSVTPPTTGKAEIHGKIGSLLEVGTGFHPDLSGRDNIYMNGSLLGIPKEEIKASFDEIVDFSGIEDFIDVPVKRYSSGMYVRLAYAVASKLRSEILILDEVLAVGDAAFQEKARSNIQEMTNSGTTVLFVSHNIHALAAICKKGILLEHGKLISQGDIKETITRHLQKLYSLDSNDGNFPHTVLLEKKDRLYQYNSKSVFKEISLLTHEGKFSTTFYTGKNLVIRLTVSNITTQFPYFAILIHNDFGERVATINSTHQNATLSSNGEAIIECVIEDLRLGEGTYSIMLDFGNCAGTKESFNPIECVSCAIKFNVELNDFFKGIGLTAFQGAAHKANWHITSTHSLSHA